MLTVLRALIHRVRWRYGRSTRALGAVAVILGGGTLLFHLTQHVTAFTALYWTITTVTTVGYGDVLPTNTDSRIVAMAVMVLGVPVLGLLLADVASGLVEGRLRRLLGMATQKMPDGYVLILGWGYSNHPVVHASLTP